MMGSMCTFFSPLFLPLLFSFLPNKCITYSLTESLLIRFLLSFFHLTKHSVIWSSSKMKRKKKLCMVACLQVAITMYCKSILHVPSTWGSCRATKIVPRHWIYYHIVCFSIDSTLCKRTISQSYLFIYFMICLMTEI